MLNERGSFHAVMASGGEYNRHAWIPAAGAKLALPFLQQAVQNTAFEDGDEPVVIGDYGSSQGKNSLVPMRAAVNVLRTRFGPERPILVVHIDQPANDFNILVNVLHEDPERYSFDDPNIFPSAIGRSFYENVLPKQYVHIGWSSYAAVWLSRIPSLVPGHFVAFASTGDVRASFERQGAEDWECFLSLRASELRQGGRLVIVLPGLDDDGSPGGFENLFDNANAALAQMVEEGVISAAERSRMVLGAYPRRRSDLLAPFRTNGQFQGLTAEHCELSALPDSAWADYERDKNKEALATRHAQFFRAIFVPSLASALNDPAMTQLFADGFEQRLIRRLADRPTPLHSFVQTIALAKQHPTPSPSRQKLAIDSQ